MKKVISRIYLTVSDQKTILRLDLASHHSSRSRLEIPLQDGEEFTWILDVFTSYGYYSRKYSINISKHRVDNVEKEGKEREEIFVLAAYVDDDRDMHIALESPSVDKRIFDPHTNYLRLGNTAKLKIDGNLFTVEVEIKAIYACVYDREKDEYYYDEDCYDYGYV